MIADYIPLALALLAVGAAAGLIAGLFGVGGGIIMVPALYYVLSALGYSEFAMHAAVGTSLSVIVVTSLRSVTAHAKRGAVDFDLLKRWTPWIVFGALAGSAVADFSPGRVLTGLFGLVEVLLAAQFFFGRPEWRLGDKMPDLPARGVLGSFIGALSSLLGIGGGVFGVTLMTFYGKTMHNAVATAAGFGVAIGLPGALGFMVAGFDEAGRAPLSLGYVNLPAFVALASTAIFLAPIGAKLAHSLDEGMLRRVFGVALLVLGLNMVREAVFGV